MSVHFGIDQLLSPLSTGEFFANHWERKPLHLERQSPTYYQELLSAKDLEDLVGDPNARYPAIQLARSGNYLPSELFTRAVRAGSEVFTGVPDLQRINAEYRSGATVVLPALQRTLPALGQFCARLQAQWDHAVHANGYLTPGNAAGFTPHYDTHEVFVLQIAGTKHWSLAPPPIELPHRSQTFNPRGYTPGAPAARVELRAGELLYVPRGWVHSAATGGSASAHITLGITVYTWVDLARDMLEACVNDVELRRALPVGFAQRADLKLSMKTRLLQTLEQLTASDHDQTIDAFVNRVRSAQAQPAETFRMNVIAIDPDAQLTAPARSRYRIFENGGHAVLEFEGKRHVLPGHLLSTLYLLPGRTIFRVRDLAEHADVNAALGLCRYLLEAGFLELDSPLSSAAGGPREAAVDGPRAGAVAHLT